MPCRRVYRYMPEGRTAPPPKTVHAPARWVVVPLLNAPGRYGLVDRKFGDQVMFRGTERECRNKLLALTSADRVERAPTIIAAE